MRVVAFDEVDQTLDAVRNGVIYGMVAQQPYWFGYESIKMLATLARGDKSVLPAGRRMIIPILAITRGNLAAYRAIRVKHLVGADQARCPCLRQRVVRRHVLLVT